MTETELRAQIKRSAEGAYLFYGEEDYLKKYYLAELRAAALADCPPGLTELNRITLTLEDGDFSAVESAILSPPMMSPKKIIEVAPPSMESWREKEKKAFLAALDALHSAPDTVFVLVAARGALDAGTPKRPTAWFKNLTAILTPVDFPLQTGVRLRRWVERHFAEEGIIAPEEAINTLLARCAPDMTGLKSEIDKLTAYAHAHQAQAVSAADVVNVTSPGIREDAFALANAVLAGNRTAALAALDVYRKRREEPIAVLASLSRVLCDLYTVACMAEEGAEKPEIARALKMHEYKTALYMKSAAGFGAARLAAALERVREADRLTKSASMGFIPLERVVCTLPSVG